MLKRILLITLGLMLVGGTIAAKTGAFDGPVPPPPCSPQTCPPGQ